MVRSSGVVVNLIRFASCRKNSWSSSASLSAGDDLRDFLSWSSSKDDVSLRPPGDIVRADSDEQIEPVFMLKSIGISWFRWANEVTVGGIEVGVEVWVSRATE